MFKIELSLPLHCLDRSKSLSPLSVHFSSQATHLHDSPQSSQSTLTRWPALLSSCCFLLHQPGWSFEDSPHRWSLLF